MAADAWPVRVLTVDLRERPVRLRLPFRYGQVTLREAPQAFVAVRLASPAGEHRGIAAELLAPKWFDKNPGLSDQANMDQLRLSLALARDRYLATTPGSCFRLAVTAREEVIADGAAHGLNPLAAGFGPSLLERAVLDAACRAAGLSFFEAVRTNLPGIDLTALAPDLGAFDGGRFLASLAPLPAVQARHTVGLLDTLENDCGSVAAPDDGLPVSLTDVIRRYGHRWFKVKVGGDPDRDLARLRRVAAVLDREAAGRYRVTLDGNEQFPSVAAAKALLQAMERDRALARFTAAVALLEQPLPRERTLDEDVTGLSARLPVIIDESDEDFDAFAAARGRGYRGVSSKQCKGIYKSLLNAARCAAWNADAGMRRYFVSAEDLSCQGGVCVQQDLALVSLLGIGHGERNGHHFGGAMPGAGREEQQGFLAAHPDLYSAVHGCAALRIRDGRIAIGSLDAPGFAHRAQPDPASLSPMPVPSDTVNAGR